MRGLHAAHPAALAVVVRPVAPGDLSGLQALLGGLSERDRYLRWFSAATDVDAAAVWATHPDGRDTLGLVATAPSGEIVGHAALVPIGDARAEVCFEVAAAWRHRGVAGRLLAELARFATQRGLRTLVAEVLSENADMLAVLRETGPHQERHERCVVEFELPLDRRQTELRPPGAAASPPAAV